MLPVCRRGPPCGITQDKALAFVSRVMHGVEHFVRESSSRPYSSMPCVPLTGLTILRAADESGPSRIQKEGGKKYKPLDLPPAPPIGGFSTRPERRFNGVTGREGCQNCLYTTNIQIYIYIFLHIMLPTSSIEKYDARTS